MANVRKIFTGGMDTDTDPRFIGEKDYLNMENCRVGLSADGKTTRVENIAGTVEIVNSNLPSGNNTVIGSAVDEERRRLIYFVYNDAGNNRIFLYDTIAGTTNVLLKDTDVFSGIIARTLVCTHSFGANHNLQYLTYTGAAIGGDVLYIYLEIGITSPPIERIFVVRRSTFGVAGIPRWPEPASDRDL